MNKVENDLKKMDVTGLRNTAMVRGTWKLYWRGPRSYMDHRASGEK